MACTEHPQCSCNRPADTYCPTQDDLQRREYAKAALTSWGEVHHCYAYTKGEAGDYGVSVMAHVCFDIADAMLAEQHKREGK